MWRSFTPVALLSLTHIGCRAANTTGHEVTPVDRAVPTSTTRLRESAATAKIATPAGARKWSFFALGSSACVMAEGHAGVSCGWPRETSLAFKPVAKTIGLADAATREACFRTTDGVAVCDGREIARDIKSVAAAPYLLRTDGRVVVAHTSTEALAPSDPHPAAAHKQDALRDAVVKTLPAFESVAGAEYATCGRTSTGEAWCWPEPSYGFNEGVEVPLLPRAVRVPAPGDIAEITLMPWLTLCARTKAGAVFCTGAAANDNVACVLRGRSDVRCGAVTTSATAPPDLAGTGYDPRLVLERALVRVPGIDDATSIFGYPRLAYFSRESERRAFLSELDEGGCARLSSGGVRCWERDSCAKGSPWRSTLVEGLPPAIARVALGANDGYALSQEGVLYTWSRRTPRGRASDACTLHIPSAFALHATREEFPAPVSAIGGGTFVVDKEPMFAAIDCATLADGKLVCWRTDESAKVRIEVRTPTDDE